MKPMIALLTVITAFQANAGGWLGGSVPRDYILRTPKCTTQMCRSNDNGYNYVDYCNFARRSSVGSQDPIVYAWHGDQNDSCYCPCDWDFENRVQKGE